jgi:TonB family protein
VSPEWHVPLCVAGSLLAHALVVAFVPHGVARAPGAQDRELVFLSIDEVLPVAPPEPEPVVQLPEPEPTPAPPLPAAAPLARRETPPPTAPPPPPHPPPPAPGAATGGPAFNAGAAGGSVHGLGSTVREGETNPSATRVTEAPAPSVDFRGLTHGYMRQLSGRIRPGVTYPRSAIVAQLEGTVTLGLVVDENGRVVRWRVKRSSGHASLDSAVLEAAQRLGSVPAPPLELRPHWRQQEISVPVLMRL